MYHKSRQYKVLTIVLVSGMLAGLPATDVNAAVITSNATDKTAVLFDEHTAYSAGDYVTLEGEMYICTEDIQGSWDVAKDSFMQITRNHALGDSGDLSASYENAADPAQEESLLAFVANAWHKLKVFFGLDHKEELTDPGNYTGASVSAKLNYLKDQNEDLGEDVAKLQKDVTDSFQYVSSGKSLLAGTITGIGVNVRQDAKFSELDAAIQQMAQLRYNDGHTDGYGSGHDDGYQDGYQQGIEEGKSEADTKTCTINTRLTFDEADSANPADNDCFSSTYDEYGNKLWTFNKTFEDHTIVGVYATEISYTTYTSGTSSHISLGVEGSYPVVTSRTNTGSKGDKFNVTDHSVEWKKFEFSRSGSGADFTNLKLQIVYI